MKRSLPAIALNHPVAVIMLLITVLGLGVIAWSRMPLEFLPKISFPFVGVSIPYPGATPEQVENEIAKVAEGEFRTISNIQRIESESDTDGCWVSMYFTLDTDMAVASAEVRDRIERLKLKLPQDVEHIRMMKVSSDAIPIMVMALFRDGPREELAELTRTEVEPRLLRQEGVADVVLRTQEEPEVLVEFDQNALRSHGLSIYQVVSSLRTSSLNVSAGELTEGDTTYFVRTLDEFSRPEDLAELVVSPAGLRLKDVADVGFRDRDKSYEITLDGKVGTVIYVRKEAEANRIATCQAVKEELERLKQSPSFEGVDVHILLDQSEVIIKARNQLLEAGKYGALLAFLVLLVFLRRVRSTLIVALAIPASLVVALAVMFFSGMTMNLVTMSSLIIAVGMLVDNSIVVIENIYRHHELGLDIRDSARRGATEVGMAITASTVTTAVVFIPMFYMDAGEMATFTRQFAVPVTVSLGASLVIALTVIPLAATHLGPSRPVHERLWYKAGVTVLRWPKRAFLFLLQPIRRKRSAFATGRAVFSIARPLCHPVKSTLGVYGACLGLTMRWRFVSLLLLLAFIVLTVAVPMRSVTRAQTPSMESDEVEIDVDLEQNFDIEMAGNVFDQLEQMVNARREQLGVENILVFYSQGGGSISAYLKEEKDYPPGESPPFTTSEVRDILWQTFPERMPGVEIESTVTEVSQSGESGSSHLRLRLRGDDARELERLAERLQALIEAVPGVRQARTDTQRAQQEQQIHIDNTLAAHAGVTPFAIAQTVDFALRGQRLPYLKQEGREVGVWAQFREEDRKSRGNLENVGVMTERVGLVPLNQLVELRKAKSPVAIRRTDGKNVQTVSAEIEEGAYSQVSDTIEEIRQNFDMPTGYSIDRGETMIEMDTDLANLLTSLLLAVILVYAVMSALFESCLLPLSILTTVPLAFIGVFWTAFLTNTPLNPIAYIGLILMVGIVVNDGIVIIDHINQLRKTGLKRYDAIVQAGRDRFRPVVMTTATTVLGCVPLALHETGGGAIFVALGRSLIGGLTSAMVLTLVIVPLVYSFIDDLQQWSINMLSNVAALTSARSAAAARAGDGDGADHLR